MITRWRRAGGLPPTQPAAVLLASTGVPFGQATVKRARELAGPQVVAVVSTVRLHGSALGLPNPGLMPTHRERDAQHAIVEAALDSLERDDVAADGQVTVTRNPASTIVRAARRRGVRDVVLQVSPTSRLRRFVEGDPATAIRRRLGSAVNVHVVN